jgi:Fe-S-cluster containining protein
MISTPTIESIVANKSAYLSALDRLAALFQQMDQAYAAVADQYGFHCKGCQDNCCQTRFYHHTLIEYLYLLEGVRQLDRATWQAVRSQALSVIDQMAQADRQGKAPRIMCPLNQDGLCLVYDHRPMICRLHGIPHELHRPNGSVQKNPGCDAFFEQCREHGKSDYIPFDRTPLYRSMAMLERTLRSQTGFQEKIKLTIAQMLAAITDKQYEIN